MVRPKRIKQHPDLQTAIKEVARKQIAENGAPVIYNYFPSRDDLVTALIVDAYHSLADALVESQETGEESHTARIMDSAHAYRGWA